MQRKSLIILLLLMCLALTGQASAQVLLFDQPFSPAGGYYHSSRWDPDDSDWDQYVWDAFRLPQNSAVTEIRWRGAFDPAYNGSGGPVRDFRIEITASAAMDTQPDVVNPPLKRYFAGGNANQTPVGPVGGVNMYEYSLVLETPFYATANTKYWVQIEALQWGVPDWCLAKAASGDGSHFRGIAGSTLYYQSISGDTTFSLYGTPGRRSAFDFDGDSKSDLAIFRPGPGELWYRKSTTGDSSAAHFGSSTDIITPADLTGDGRTDMAFFRPSTGFWYVLRSENMTFYAFPFGSEGDVPVPADFDGDGKADAAVFRPSTATWYVSRSNGGTLIAQFGLSTDQPVAADYDGDGKADIAVFRPTGENGAEWWAQRSTAGLFAAQFGIATDKAVPADYTGDGKADLAFWRPSNGNWYILRSEDFSFYGFPFGAPADLPVPGDYDGDGKTDAAVFRPSNSIWYANRSTSGTLIQQFGSTGDQPVPNAYVR